MVEFNLVGVASKVGATLLTATVIAVAGFVVENRAVDAEQEVRIQNLENRFVKIDSIDINVNRINNKVDVLTQRIEDNKELLREARRK